MQLRLFALVAASAFALVKGAEIETEAVCAWDAAANSCGLSLTEDLNLIFPDEADTFVEADSLYSQMVTSCPNLPIKSTEICPAGCSVQISLDATNDICVPQGTSVDEDNARDYLKAWTDDLCGQGPQTSVCIQGRIETYKYFGCDDDCDKTLDVLQAAVDKCEDFKSREDCANTRVSGAAGLQAGVVAVIAASVAALLALL